MSILVFFSRPMKPLLDIVEVIKPNVELVMPRAKSFLWERNETEIQQRYNKYMIVLTISW